MLRNITGDTMRFVSGIYGMPGEGYIQLDPAEAYQVVPLRDAILRGALIRTQFLIQIVHGAGGLGNSSTVSFWSVTNWTAVTNGQPVPAGHDLLILGGGITSSNGSSLITAASLEVQWTPAAGVTAIIPLFSTRISPWASVHADLIQAQRLPYPLDRQSAPVITGRSEVTGATTITFTVDTLSAPIGVIPFA